MSSSHKGSAWEREVSKKLSLWWSNGQNDGIFWRTSGSGARAYVRSKKGIKTKGHGDIQATDPIGQPLLDCCTIEIKRGYSHETFANTIETSESAKAKPPMFYTFITQARLQAKQAGTKYWLLISKRDRRAAIITMPLFLWKRLLQGRGWKFDKAYLSWVESSVIIIHLSEFLGFFVPKDFKQL